MPRPIRIGLCQLTSANTIEEGFTKVDSAIAEIASQGGNLAIFPEYFVQGIVADAPHKIFDEGKWEQHVSELARKYGMDICIGTFVEKVVSKSFVANACEGVSVPLVDGHDVECCHVVVCVQVD